MSLFQNPIGFGTSSWKNRQKSGFSVKSREAVPKTEILEQPRIIAFFSVKLQGIGGCISVGQV
jgi:hypothetical protein